MYFYADLHMKVQVRFKNTKQADYQREMLEVKISSSDRVMLVVRFVVIFDEFITRQDFPSTRALGH